jgi:hypothetical protein
MPFRHVVMMKFADGLDHEFIDTVRERFNQLPQDIQVIRSFVHGADVGISEGNYDYGVIADFDNLDDYRTYRDHPQHVLLIAEILAGNVIDRVAIQLKS